MRPRSCMLDRLHSIVRSSPEVAGTNWRTPFAIDASWRRRNLPSCRAPFQFASSVAAHVFPARRLLRQLVRPLVLLTSVVIVAVLLAIATVVVSIPAPMPSATST